MAQWRKTAFLGAVAGLVLGACSPMEALNRLVPDHSYRLNEGVAYGPHPRQKLDVYRPAEATPPTPVVVFYYGGGWKSGERAHYRFVGESLARRGLTVVVPDYRLYPDVQFPVFVEDSAAAAAWALENIGEYGGDPDRLFLAGHSAGGYNAALVGVDPSYLRAEGKSPGDLCGVITLAGPVSFDPLQYNSTRPIFETASNPESTRPVNHIGPSVPPFLLIHGLNDDTVKPVNAKKFAEKMKETGNPVTLQLLPGIGHYRIIAALAAPFEGWIMPLGDRIADFVRNRPACQPAPSPCEARLPPS